MTTPPPKEGGQVSLKLLVASHLYPNAMSHTAGSFVHNQVRFLRAYGDIEVIAPKPWFPALPGFGRWSAIARLPRHEALDSIQVCRPPYLTYPRRFLFGRVWRSYLRVLERSTGQVPDLIHAHCAYPDGRAAVEYGRRLGCPVVITVHGHDIKDLPRLNPQWRRLTVEALEGADRVIAVSGELRQMVEELGIAPERIRQIPNGVDCQVFKPDGQRRPGEDGWHLIYVGRFVAAKGIGVLLEAMALLRRQRQDLRLSLVGGSSATGTADLFQAQAKELDLDDCVAFVDEVSYTAMPAHMNRADLFVLPSFSEGLPLVLVEALACGLPIVSTRCGGPTELVQQGLGQLVEVGDAQDLARGIKQVLDHYSEYDPHTIRRRAEEQYDYRAIAARIHQVYREVVPLN